MTVSSNSSLFWAHLSSPSLEKVWEDAPLPPLDQNPDFSGEMALFLPEISASPAEVSPKGADLVDQVAKGYFEARPPTESEKLSPPMVGSYCDVLAEGCVKRVLDPPKDGAGLEMITDEKALHAQREKEATWEAPRKKRKVERRVKYEPDLSTISAGDAGKVEIVLKEIEKQENLSQNIKNLIAKAESGDAEARSCLGLCCFEGREVAQKFEHAFTLFASAAIKGNPCAQCNLAYCYRHGKGCKSKRKLGIRWFHMAADGGCVPGDKGTVTYQSCQLIAEAIGYQLGRGREKNSEKAVACFLQAGGLKNLQQLHQLGVNYLEGRKYYEKDQELGLLILSAGSDVGDAACRTLLQSSCKYLGMSSVPIK